MLLKAFAVTLIILSVYFLGTILRRLIHDTAEEDQGLSYHLGCFESEGLINASKQMEQYLFNLSKETAPYSVTEVKKYQQKVESRKVKTDTANTLAIQFKKYITAYQNMKSLNQYQQSYSRGMRVAHDDFLKCRGDFLKQDWRCKEYYTRYLQTEQEFALIKSNLSVLIQQKYLQQGKIEKLLEADEVSNKESYESYRGKIQGLNKQLERYQQIVKQKNETLVGYENKEFKLIQDLNIKMKQTEDCQRNKKEIQTCKVINERLKMVFTGVDLKDLANRVQSKRKIIQKYNNALVKSNKLGQDTSVIKDQLAKNTQELNKLLELYSQTQVISICSGDFIKKCSDQEILQLQANITSIQQNLGKLRPLQTKIRHQIQDTLTMISQLYQLKDQILEEYQNSSGSIDELKEIQATTERKLKQHKQNINNINFGIAGARKNISNAEQNRKKAIYELDVILSRVGNLAQCLSKKEYLVKLQSKQPERRSQDQKLKRQAGQALIRILRSAYV